MERLLEASSDPLRGQVERLLRDDGGKVPPWPGDLLDTVMTEDFMRMMRLPPQTFAVRAREVLTVRLGLLDGRRKTLEETGQRFQLTRERVRQIEARFKYYFPWEYEKLKQQAPPRQRSKTAHKAAVKRALSGS